MQIFIISLQIKYDDRPVFIYITAWFMHILIISLQIKYDEVHVFIYITASFIQILIYLNNFITDKLWWSPRFHLYYCMIYADIDKRTFRAGFKIQEITYDFFTFDLTCSTRFLRNLFVLLHVFIWRICVICNFHLYYCIISKICCSIVVPIVFLASPEAAGSYPEGYRKVVFMMPMSVRE